MLSISAPMNTPSSIVWSFDLFENSIKPKWVIRIQTKFFNYPDFTWNSDAFNCCFYEFSSSNILWSFDFLNIKSIEYYLIFKNNFWNTDHIIFFCFMFDRIIIIHWSNIRFHLALPFDSKCFFIDSCSLK